MQRPMTVKEARRYLYDLAKNPYCFEESLEDYPELEKFAEGLLCLLEITETRGIDLPSELGWQQDEE